MSQTVLVADDSQTIRKVVQMALKASDYEVVGVSSARAAMEAAQQLPTVILLDYHMPDGSGYDVCRALKGNQATRQIPVVMLGGTYKNFDAELARSSGASQVVMKPFLTDELLGAIESAVRGTGQAPPPPQLESRPQPPQTAMEPPQQASLQPLRPPPPPLQSQANGQSMDTPFAAPEPRENHPQPTPPPRWQEPRSDSQPVSVPSQSPVPESQPRINVNSGMQSRMSASDRNSEVRPHQPSPLAEARSISNVENSAPAMSPEEIQAFIREEVKNAVREELPGLLRNVMGEVFQQKVLPKLLSHSDAKIQRALEEQLDHRISQQVRLELERLFAEE